jgi:glycosyltransferase involved in cell wall biosynthesis
MTRILHIATRFRRGGAERNIAHVIAWEQRAGFEVHLAIGPDIEEVLVPPGVTKHRIDTLIRRVDPLRDTQALIALRQLIRTGDFEIVHTHLSKAGILGRLAGRTTARKLAHTVHMSSFGPGYSAPSSFAFRAAERRVSAYTNLTAFVGTELKSQYLANNIGDPKHAIVVRSCVNLEGLIATRAWDGLQQIKARESLGVPNDRRLLISVGVLEPRKRQGLIIELLAPLLREGRAHLAVAGAGDQAPLRLLARKLGVLQHITFTGHLDDITPLYGAADLLVHAAEVEGVPQVVLQGLAAGLPVVATKVVGLAEVRGSRVAVVPQSGKGLERAVDDQLNDPPPPVAASEFTDWSPNAVDFAISEFHNRLAS